MVQVRGDIFVLGGVESVEEFEEEGGKYVEKWDGHYWSVLNHVLNQGYPLWNFSILSHTLFHTHTYSSCTFHTLPTVWSILKNFIMFGVSEQEHVLELKIH